MTPAAKGPSWLAQGLILLGVIFQLLLGAVLGTLFIALAGGSVPGLLLLALSFVLALAVHELGHVLFGLWRGFEFVELGIGPLVLGRSGVRWGSGGRLGFALMVPPPDGGDDGDWRWFLSGGVLLGFMAGCAALVLSPRAPGAAHALLLGFGLVSTLLAALNALPFGRPQSDGVRVWRLRRGAPERAQDLAVLRLTGFSLRGWSPDEWSAADLGTLERPLSNPTLELAAATARFEHAAWTGQAFGCELRRLESVRDRLPSRLLRAAANASLALGWARLGELEHASRALRAADVPQLRGVAPHLLLLADRKSVV